MPFQKGNQFGKLNKGKRLSFKTEFKKGHKHSPEILKKISNSLKGRKFSLESIKKSADSRRGKYCNEKNWQWKGEKVSYRELHKWIRKYKPLEKVCNNCRLEKKLEVANISNEYKRDISDFEWLCRRCHMIKDGRMKSWDHK